MGCEGLCVGAEQILFLSGERPATTGEGMIAVPASKNETREAFTHLLFQRDQKLIHREHGIVFHITGVGCGYLLFPNQEGLLQYVLFSMMIRIRERTNMSKNGMAFGDFII